ncbi:hypothetical protein V865_006331 [Kwoniella europaea PYCC6329]|uniref:Uncharacterized protein n=1 Tax=Kwoniella europaea PYCC6329 TaxID=1423913 RepID=A0AAX4KRQ0_9TREE
MSTISYQRSVKTSEDTNSSPWNLPRGLFLYPQEWSRFIRGSNALPSYLIPMNTEECTYEPAESAVLTNLAVHERITSDDRTERTYAIFARAPDDPEYEYMWYGSEGSLGNMASDGDRLLLEIASERGIDLKTFQGKKLSVRLTTGEQVDWQDNYLEGQHFTTFTRRNSNCARQYTFDHSKPSERLAFNKMAQETRSSIDEEATRFMPRPKVVRQSVEVDGGRLSWTKPSAKMSKSDTISYDQNPKELYQIEWQPRCGSGKTSMRMAADIETLNANVNAYSEKHPEWSQAVGIMKSGHWAL